MRFPATSTHFDDDPHCNNLASDGATIEVSVLAWSSRVVGRELSTKTPGPSAGRYPYTSLHPRTEEACVYWIRRYIVFHGKTHPSAMGAAEVATFLTRLAVRQRVSASTQNQELSALLFLYRQVTGHSDWRDRARPSGAYSGAAAGCPEPRGTERRAEAAHRNSKAGSCSVVWRRSSAA
jgi:Phage integrase, N-terminal SAM-like domain